MEKSVGLWKELTILNYSFLLVFCWSKLPVSVSSLGEETNSEGCVPGYHNF